MSVPESEKELTATSSCHILEEEEEDDLVHITNDEVPSHFKVVLTELRSCRNKRPRYIKSKGAVLVLIITCMINVSYNAALGGMMSVFFKEILHITEAGVLVFLGIIFVRALPQLAYPLAGWVADVHYGRYKVILVSLWLMLSGHIIILIAFLIKYFYDPPVLEYIVYWGIFPATFLIINTGLAAFQANVIPFGLDQMPDGSTEEVSAFIHWYYGIRNILAGMIPLGACYISRFELTSVMVSLSEVVCITFALLLCFCCNRHFIIEPKSRNPFQLVHRVLKFALKNKHPIMRSAFTFWEADIPSRVDLGKSKYGGPFSTEEVEDVKTFIRTTIVLAALSVFMLSYYTMLAVNALISAVHLAGALWKQLRMYKQVGILFSSKLESAGHIGGSHCQTALFYQIVLDTFPVLIMVAVFETVIYPFFKMCIPSMLRRIGLGLGVAIVGLLVLLVLDAYGYNQLLDTDSLNVTRHEELNCYLINATLEEYVHISAHAISVIMLIGALAETLVFIAALEFIASQSPYSMRGMLIGVFYCMRGIAGFLSVVFILAFTLGFASRPLSPTSGISCGLPLNATAIVLSLVGLAVYIKVARNHKRRERDEQFNTRTFAEKYYYGSLTTSIVSTAST